MNPATLLVSLLLYSTTLDYEARGTPESTICKGIRAESTSDGQLLYLTEPSPKGSFQLCVANERDPKEPLEYVNRFCFTPKGSAKPYSQFFSFPAFGFYPDWINFAPFDVTWSPDEKRGFIFFGVRKHVRDHFSFTISDDRKVVVREFDDSTLFAQIKEHNPKVIPESPYFTFSYRFTSPTEGVVTVQTKVYVAGLEGKEKVLLPLKESLPFKFEGKSTARLLREGAEVKRPAGGN